MPHHVVETRNSPNVYPSILNIIYFHQSNVILQFLKKIYMFPALKTKTTRNILDILVDDWKYTGTLNSNSALDILIKTFTPNST